jgi:hypothetical protein
MKNFLPNSIAALFCLAGMAAMAGDFDGSKPLICAPVVVMDCVVDEGCTKGTPSDMGAPAFMRIDFAKKLVIGPKRVTPIMFIDKNEKQVLLQGHELGFGWTMVVDAEGRLITSMIDHSGAFLMYGSCTTL